MISLLLILAKIGLVLFLIGAWSGMNIGSVIGGLGRFLLGVGFSTYMVWHGHEFVDSWFEGVKHLAYILGCPPADPSAIASYGPKVADPIMKSIAAQGFLTYLFSWMTYSYMFAGWAIILAFIILAAQLMGFLFLSYFLVAACPFFFAFAVMPYTAGLTYSYVKMILGTMAGLFCVILMTAIVSEMGALMEMALRTQLLAPGVTLTWTDYMFPLIVGIALCIIFVWLPPFVAKSVGGMIPSWSGSGMVWSFGASAVSGVAAAAGAAGGAISNAMSGGSSGSMSGGGGQSQVAAGHSYSGGSGLAAAQQPAKSGWGA